MYISFTLIIQTGKLDTAKEQQSEKPLTKNPKNLTENPENQTSKFKL